MDRLQHSSVVRHYQGGGEHQLGDGQQQQLGDQLGQGEQQRQQGHVPQRGHQHVLPGVRPEADTLLLRIY